MKRLLALGGLIPCLMGLFPIPASAAMSEITVAAVGDFQCEDEEYALNACPHVGVSDMIDSYSPSSLLALGDLVQWGTQDEFDNRYDPDFGHWETDAYPTVGNHEYIVSGAAPYENYFGSRVDENGYFNYSFDLGEWHFVVINTNCAEVGCGSSSPQLNWVRDDLDNHLTGCTAVIAHHPIYASGSHNMSGMGTFFNALDNRNVDLYLNGHQANYERLAKIGNGGDLDSHGIRSFTVGTGGYPINAPSPNEYSKKIIGLTKGAMFLTLNDDYYGWRFRNVNGTTLDVGSDDCD